MPQHILDIDGVGISRLVEATGAPSIVNNCFSLLRKGAKLVLIGANLHFLNITEHENLFPGKKNIIF